MESHEMALSEKKENPSSIKRVIGVPKEKEEKIKAQFAERFSKQEVPELKKMGIKEVEKTPEQIEIIKYASELIEGVSKKYGGSGFKIPVEKVRILKGEAYDKFRDYFQKNYNRKSPATYTNRQ